jgi:hypothetical protein
VSNVQEGRFSTEAECFGVVETEIAGECSRLR